MSELPRGNSLSLSQPDYHNEAADVSSVLVRSSSGLDPETASPNRRAGKGIPAARTKREFCRHLHSANGCALGSHCPSIHTGMRGDSGAIAAMRDIERMRISAQVTAESEYAVFWVYRENHSWEGGVQWKNLPQQASRTLEAAFSENPQAAAVQVTASCNASFAQMMLFNRMTGGERRPLQRVLLSSQSQWFAVPLTDSDVTVRGSMPMCGSAPIKHLSVGTAEILEHAFVSGVRSCFGLLAAELPCWINLHRMRMIVIATGETFHLHRQPVAAVPGGPVSDLYRHRQLQTTSVLASEPGQPILQCHPGQHLLILWSRDREGMNTLTHLGLPLVLDLDELEVIRPPVDPCSGIRCIHRRDTAHLRKARHPCPQGLRAECFLCSAVATVASGSVAIPPLLAARAHAHARLFDPMRRSDADAEQNPSREALRAWLTRQRATSDLRAVFQNAISDGSAALSSNAPSVRRCSVVSPSRFGLVAPQDVFGGDLTARSPLFPQRSPALPRSPPAGTAGPSHDPSNRIAVVVPPSVTPPLSAGATSTAVATGAARNPGVHLSPDDLSALRIVSPRPGVSPRPARMADAADDGVPALLYLDPDGEEHATVVTTLGSESIFHRASASHVQRIADRQRYLEYIRWRNEAVQTYFRLSAEAAVELDEQVLFMPVASADACLSDSTVQPCLGFPTLDLACFHADAAAAYESRESKTLHVMAVVAYQGPQRPAAAVHSSSAERGSGVHATCRYVAADPADSRFCVVATSETETDRVRLVDASQFSPMYLFTLVTRSA
jgi:hypothetical protein